MPRALAKLRCWRQGHDLLTLMLPEDGWGLYSVSRIVCKRCGHIELDSDPFMALARYNADRSRGVVFEDWYHERMAVQQEYFDQRQAAR